MDEQSIINLINQTLNAREQANSYGVSLVPYHTHNGTDSPLITTGVGTVSSVSVVNTNGFSGTVSNATSTPAITITTTVTGVLQGNGTALSAVTIGSGLSFSGGTLSATAGSTLTVNADETSATAFTTQINFISTQNTASNGWTLAGAGPNASYGPIGSNGFGVSNAGIATLVANARMQIVAPSASNINSFSADTPNIIRLRFYGRIRSATANASNRVAVGFSDLTGGSDFYSETATDGRDVKFVFTLPVAGTPTTYAVCSNATSVTANNINIDATNWHIYEIVLTPQTNAKFYVDGTLLSTITTNLYASGSQLLNFEIGSFNNNNTADIEIYMHSPTFSINL